jgi:predicted metal-dependent enzyme (double-stranded beta helix superfamily)
MLLMEVRQTRNRVATEERSEAVSRRLSGLRLGSGRLSVTELEEVVAAVAGDRELWSDLAGSETPAARERITLLKTPNYEVLLLVWSPNEPSDWHDHGGSSGGYAVVDGELSERYRAADGVEILARRLAAGSAGGFGPAHLHDVVPAAEERAVSVHAYSPPISTMTYYERTQLGFVAREVVPEE